MRFPGSAQQLVIGRPQRAAAVLLFLFFLQCLWVVHHQTLTERDYRFARCGREMWEKPSPLTGYFTTCGNMQDGTLAYRAAGFPLTVQRILLGHSANASTWEMRHELSYVKLLLRLPFLFFGIWLGGGLWWVARRLFGNEGGFLALALYCFSPEIVRASSMPNNELLAMWGLYGVFYTAIGVAHAMQGPRRKWRLRIALLTVAFGLTAAAHIAAAVVGLLLSLLFMLYLAEGRRGYVLQVLSVTSIGTLLILFASYAFKPDAFSYVFSGGAARMWFSLDGVKMLVQNPSNACIVIAAALALLLYLVQKRSRYFGNTTPLLVTLLLLPLITTGVRSEPWLWALPFLFTFIGGVFADIYETRYRKLYLYLTAALLITQAGLCIASLPLLVIR
ncbi:MAG: hypothetical protein ACYC46_09895 [Acidobacteriaceae bacterium]